MTASNPEIEQYLRPTEVIDSDNPEIIRFARETVGDASDPVEQAKRLFYQVRDTIAYDPRTPFFLPEHYRASYVLKAGRGYCVPKACLMCAAARALGIPARLGLADIRNHGASGQLVEMMGCNLFTYHGFAELYLNGKWVKATVAFDLPIFQRHNVAPAEFDGAHDAVYPAHTLSGEPYVEYVRYHGSYADLPLDDLLAAWKATYGEDRVQFWMKAFTGSGNFKELMAADFKV
jgi:transglutaminase-like putative cysteine protease